MARKSARKELLPWASANRDNIEPGGYLQLGLSLIQCAPFQKLGYGAGLLYLVMAAHAKGKAEFTFSHGDAKRYGFPASTFDKYRNKLIDAGFLEQLVDDDRGQFTKAKFRFRYAWKL